LNALDIIILIFVIFFALFGLKKGILKSVFTYISVICGILLAVKFNYAISFVLRSFIKDSKVTQIIAVILIFMILYLIGIFIASKISKINKMSEVMDRIGGFFFGGLKSVLILGLILIVLNSYNVISVNQKSNSFLYAPVTNSVPLTYNFLKDLIPVQKNDFYRVLNHLDLDSLKSKLK
jgi:membrane protein required for colicin V production